MAIDTADKRCSAIATRRLPWFRRFAPIPDGTVDAGDRAHLALVYSGISPAEPVGQTNSLIGMVGMRSRMEGGVGQRSRLDGLTGQRSRLKGRGGLR